MKILFFSGRAGGGRSRYLNLAHPLCLGVITIMVLGTLGTAFAIGMQLGQRAGGHGGGDSDRFHRMIVEQQAEIAQLKAHVQERADALAARLGALNAHIIRIDALGKHLTSMTNVDRREFNFDEEPKATPGSEPSGGRIADIATALTNLEQRVDLRDAQLAALENVINERKIDEAVRPAGSPVAGAVITSHFGERSDPVTGEDGHFHKGLDLAGAKGEAVEAVAAGVVTQAGVQTGYGNLVEINHGNGYVTRYGHNEKILVKIGQSVVRGEEIALLGSTGHSTGPHVHFEVLRNGKPVDPLSFVKPNPTVRQVASR